MFYSDPANWEQGLDEQVQFSVLGGRVVLVCDVDMNPWGQFEWMFEEGDLPSNVLVSDNVITITAVETYNIGNYTCVATNEILVLRTMWSLGLN